jgi:effector-binding domain-containing protein
LAKEEEAMTEFTITEVSPQRTAVVSARVTLAELPRFFSRTFSHVAAALARQGIVPSAPPFAFYTEAPGEWVEVEAGFPVTRQIQADGEVVPSKLPGGSAVTGMHIGPYETLEVTYEELESWIRVHHLSPSGGMWEVYLAGPEANSDPNSWRTQIFQPVVHAAVSVR